MGRINIELDNEIHKKLKILCAVKEKTIQEYLNELLEEKLKKQKVK